jgi:hypothetical protein
VRYGPDRWSPSPGDRARLELLDDATRSNAEIAVACRSTRQQVAAVRRGLYDLGVLIPPGPKPQRFPAFKALPRPPASLMQGACVGHAEPDLWTSANLRDREEAKAVCAGCHVAPQCLEWALTLPESDLAMYAGTTSSERFRIRARRRPGSMPYRATTAGKNAARQRRRAAAAQAAQQAARQAREEAS